MKPNVFYSAPGGGSGFRGASTRKPGEQDQNQAIEKERDDQGRGVAEAQVFKKKFQSSERDGGIGHPAEFDVVAAGAKQSQGESEGAIHDGADHGKTGGARLQASSGDPDDCDQGQSRDGGSGDDGRNHPEQAPFRRS